MNRILVGDVVSGLAQLPEGCVQTCVTSPPYYGLRDYGVAGQIGLEPTPEEFIARMVEVFRAVHRVLRADGTAWVNMGDSYSNDGKWGGSTGGKHVAALHGNTGVGRQRKFTGYKPKDMMGMPWMLAFALRADGWYFPEALVEPCILAGSRAGDLVLDPFMGSGTTAVVAQRLGRNYVGCELNPAYAAMAERRIASTQPGLQLA